MGLGKRQLLGLIQDEENYLKKLENDKQKIKKNREMKNEDIEILKIESCANDIAVLRTEARLEILRKILKTYYPTKKKRPSRLQIINAKVNFLKCKMKRLQEKGNEKYLKIKLYRLPEWEEKQKTLLEFSKLSKKVKTEI